MPLKKKPTSLWSWKCKYKADHTNKAKNLENNYTYKSSNLARHGLSKASASAEPGWFSHLASFSNYLSNLFTLCK